MQRPTGQATPPNPLSPLLSGQAGQSVGAQIGAPTSPVRFATSTNAFGLAASPSSSSSSHGHGLSPAPQLIVETSPLSGVKPRLRRPSMLSLGPPTTFKADPQGEESDDEEDIEGAGEGSDSRPRQGQVGTSRMARGGVNPFELSQPMSRWQGSSPGFLSNKNRGDSGSAIGLEALSTTTPPIPTTELVGDNLSLLDRSPPRWLPGHLGRRKGKARAEDSSDLPLTPDAHRPPLSGPALPASLLATLKSETSPLDHEYKSEARLQRLISSHPRAVPFTPRTSRSSRGRFPDEAGDEDDDDDFPSRRALWASRAWTRRSSSDSDSDDMSMSMPIDDYNFNYGAGGSGSVSGRGGGGGGGAGEPVNAAFAAGMDMERMASASEQEGSGKSTPGAGSGSGRGSLPPPGQGGATTPAGANSGFDRARPPRMSFSGGLIASPGAGFGLPSAFGGLGMGGGTPIGSPTIERLELATSPLSNSPSLMQYRESTGGSASHRPGKRKAGMDRMDDRFDPYKRPRGSSPALSASGGMGMGMGMLGMSPSRTSYIPIPGAGNGGTYPYAGSGGMGGLSGNGGNNGNGPPSSPMPTYGTYMPLPSASGFGSNNSSNNNHNNNATNSANSGLGNFSFALGQSGPLGPTSGAGPGVGAGANANVNPNASGSNMTNLRQGPGRSGHPYTRPLSSRSRAPSPALSVGSNGGTGLSGVNRAQMGMQTLGQAFQMSGQAQGQGQVGVQGLGQQGQMPPGGLGSLGLLSLTNSNMNMNVTATGQGQAQVQGQLHQPGESGTGDEESGGEGDRRGSGDMEED